MKNFTVLLILAILLGSCGSEEDLSILSPEEARASLEQMESNLAADISAISNAQGVVAISQILDINIEDLLNQRSGSQGTSLKAQMEQFRFALSRRLSNGKVAEEDCFNFESKTGVYNYNIENDEFEPVGPSEFIILNFPAEGSEVNNATFRVLRFNETSFPIFGEEEICLPSQIEMDLAINGTVELELDIRISYNSQFFLNTFNLDLFVNPYSLQLSIDNTAAESVRVSATLASDIENIITTDITSNFTDNTKVETASVSGLFEYRNIRFTGSVSGFSDFFENPDADPNRFIDIEVFDGNAKLGDVVLVAEEDDDEYDPYVQLSDGSLVSIEELFEMLLEGSDFFG